MITKQNNDGFDVWNRPQDNDNLTNLTLLPNISKIGKGFGRGLLVAAGVDHVTRVLKLAPMIVV